MNITEKNEYVISWVRLGEPLTIIIGILILNKFIYKYLEGRSREKIIIVKLIIGMGFAVLAVCTTGIIEYFRLKEYCSSNAKQLSIYFQILEYSLMGFSQLFAMVGSYEFSYYAAPFSAQSLFMSLHFCSIGLPAAISTFFPIQFEVIVEKHIVLLNITFLYFSVQMQRHRIIHICLRFTFLY